MKFTENKKIILQEYSLSDLSFLEDNNNNTIQLTLREWNPGEWKMSQPVEILFKKGSTFLDLSQIIQEKFPHIPVKIKKLNNL